MLLVKKLRQYLTHKNAASAYNLWSETYDRQPGNLMLDLDEDIFTALLQQCSLKDKIVADVGCGTGRHWSKIHQQHPQLLAGYDVSAGMLDRLRNKYPDAIVKQITSHLLPQTPDLFFDVLISTLTIAHIKDLEGLFTEWSRVLKPGGDILITDFHPAALQQGGQRTFLHRDRSVIIRNYVHSIKQIETIARINGLEMTGCREIHIAGQHRPYYEDRNAVSVFEKFQGVAIIYGMHLKKADDIA